MKRKITKDFPKSRGKRVPVAIVFTLMSSAVLFAQKQWVDVTDAYLVNADYSMGTNEGWTDGTAAPTVNATWQNAEFYQSANSAAQKVLGLQPGKYKLTVRGYYRAGGNDGGAAYEAGTEVINAYLFAGTDSVKLKSLYSEAKDTELANNRNGWPDGLEGANVYFAKYPESYLNEVTFDVDAVQDMLMGIAVKTNSGSTWTCWDDFKLYIEGTEFDSFSSRLSKMTVLRDSLNILGVASANELTTLIDKYSTYTESTPSEEVKEAEAVIKEMNELALSVCGSAVTLNADIKKAEELYTKMENGTYTVPASVKTELQAAITAAKDILAKPTLDEVSGMIADGITAMGDAITKANGIVGLSYPLQTAKALADKIGGLNTTEEYKKVEADLNSSELAYDDVVLDVAALNVLCKDKMTADFLSTASADNPIDMTSFIVNPNIYQNGEVTEVPGGWIIGNWGSADNKNPTTDAHTDTDLRCYSWSGNAANNIANAHYYQKIGGTEEGAVNLPDGLYELSAATYINGDDKKVMLYASSDSVNFVTEWFNTDQKVYDDARDVLGTTTSVQNVIVSGGQLYIGVKGTGIVGGSGKHWNADNFRLSYVGADALSAYRERLQGRLDEGEILHDSLMTYGIDDSEYYGWALDPEDGYYAFLEEGGVDEITEAIDQLDEMNTSAKQVITNYLAFNPLVVSGNNLMDQLNNGQLYAQPTAKETFMTALEAAATVAEDMTWDNYLSEDITTQTEALKVATTTLMNSVALCYPMGTAKELADQIGGLADEQAYKDVVTYLGLDELDPIDVDLAVKALQEVCINAMTPEVLAKASAEAPLNMTTFVVNPNIYQDEVDDEGTPINTKVNGWICESSADSPSRTAATSGDTWLYCYSWSGHSSINIAQNTNYRQVVGTQINEEGKFALPTGAYRVEAATYATSGAGALELYALTNEVETSVVPDINGQDSIVYTYTELESADSTFNGDKDMWDDAQASLATTTVIPEIYVDKGAVTIGVRGNGGVVGGNGHSWIADNFRLYYVGQERGSDIQGAMANAEDLASEIVDVYDITGKLVRKQVKRADAVKGLKRGIYIAGGKKYVVTGK